MSISSAIFQSLKVKLAPVDNPIDSVIAVTGTDEQTHTTKIHNTKTGSIVKKQTRKRTKFKPKPTMSGTNYLYVCTYHISVHNAAQNSSDNCPCSDMSFGGEMEVTGQLYVIVTLLAVMVNTC